MKDEKNDRHVAIDVSLTALDGAQRLAEIFRNPYASLVAAFDDRRADIEEIASRKYDEGQLTQWGTIEITDPELNPDIYM